MIKKSKSMNHPIWFVLLGCIHVSPVHAKQTETHVQNTVL